ncbi:MAG: preprotein translocase subunit SecY [Candidatus Asgardarchaeia archaeon]
MVEISKLARFLPTVERPVYKPSINKKLMWTGLVLIIYFMLSSQMFGRLYKVAPGIIPRFQTLQMLFGSNFGTLMTLGIGPIVNSSIILQLLVGSKILDWDLSKPEEKRKYDTIQKMIAILFCFLVSFAYVVSGTVPPVSRDGFTIAIVVIQLVVGGLIVMLLDEIVSKYGIGSGISLFIAAGVINRIFISLFSPCMSGMMKGCTLPTHGGEPIGRVWAFLMYLAGGEFQNMVEPLLPIVMTILIFFIIIYAQSVSVDIPLTFSAVRGFSRRWSLNLFYTSNIPVILTVALLSTLQLTASISAKPVANELNTRCGILGCFRQTSEGDNVPISGPVYFLTAPHGILLDIFTGNVTSRLLLRALIYLLFMVGCSILFSVFWVSTSGMDPESMADQICSIGMQIPGYRSESAIIKRVLEKYIPYLAVLGGAAIGFLAALADFVGALGTGTGILLTVTIIYGFYQQIKAERLEGAHPLLRRLLGEE